MAFDLPHRFWSKVDTSSHPNGCWEWTANRAVKGYGQIWWNGTTCRATRVLWESMHGPIPLGMQVMHRCDNPPCVNPEHLLLGTALQNQQDKAAKGRSVRGDATWARRHPERLRYGDTNPSRLYPERLMRGESHPRSKVTAENVLEMRRLAADGVPQAEIGRRYGVGQTSVSNYVHGKSWRHI